MEKNLFICNNYSFPLGRKTYTMGILNVTPDSFSDGNMFFDTDKAIRRVFELEQQGADIIDIGAQSTRPGYERISDTLELERLLPVLKGIVGKVNVPISIDTFYPKVAYEALGVGADVINDVYGFEDKNMFDVCKNYNCGMIMTYGFEGLEMKKFFESKLHTAEKLGINPQRICFDPGVGFSKSYAQDVEIIKNVKNYKLSKNAFLIGCSRKRVVRYSSDEDVRADNLTFGSVSMSVIAALNGADFLRVHDVKETVGALKIVDNLYKDGLSHCFNKYY